MFLNVKSPQRTDIQHSFVSRHIGFHPSTLTPEACDWFKKTKARLLCLAPPVGRVRL